MQTLESDRGDADLVARYQRAKTLADGAMSKTVAFNTTLYPHWIGDTDSFWYVRQSRHGQTYRLVDAKAATNTPAFDHDKLSGALSAASGEALAADNLPLVDLDFTEAPAQIHFSALNKRWSYSSASDSCECLYTLEYTRVSPDGKHALFRREHNLWVRELASGKERALTQDGKRCYVYAETPTAIGVRVPPETVEALWSPDSKKIFTLVMDTRHVERGMPLVEHVPTDGSVRSRIIDPDRRVAYPADEHVDVYRFLSIELKTGNTQFAQTADCPITFLPYMGYFTGHRGWWGIDNRHAYFIEEERGMKAHRLQRMDTETGVVTTIVEERSDHLAMLIPSSHVMPLSMPMPDTNEVIWYSERSGTAHFYLYDTLTGELKHPITQGDWIVRNGLRIDAARRELTFQTAARVEGRIPYFCDICRVNIDTGELTTVLSTDHEYIVCDERSRVSFDCLDQQVAYGVSPSANYIVTTRSRVDEVPVSLLLDRAGRELMVVETADVTGLPDNCLWPEPVMLKAEDGETDIYGVVYRPSNFDPGKTYPVLDCTTGYCSPVGSFTNNGGPYFHLALWAFAELGFIVVAVFNRGTERLRDRAFNDYINPAFPADPCHLHALYNNDCVAGIKQLAERIPSMDIDRVGVVEFGHSPRAIVGLFLYPDFYKVGVSIGPDTDQRIKSSMGMDFRDKTPVQLMEMASRLEGKLLIMASMLDRCVPVSMTFRLVDKLYKANKRFDMLILPGERRSLFMDSYLFLRCCDYFVEHLLGLEPPKNITTDKEPSS